MKTLVVGDIHGCWTEFRELLDLASLGEDDRLIAIGNLVDRGPDTTRVLDYFRTSAHARSLMGNHELKHVRASRGELQLSRSQQISRRQIGEAHYPRAVKFMAGLPPYIELPEFRLLAVRSRMNYWESVKAAHRHTSEGAEKRGPIR
jgi:serine/threonine protein phosphatase 1